MADDQSFLSKVGSWFRRDKPADDVIGEGQNGLALDTRGSLLRPWAKRDNAIEALSRSFNTLTDLMGSIKDGLEASAQRQDQLLDALKHLPTTLDQIPESNRKHGETLNAIARQIEGQQEQQKNLALILNKFQENDAVQREAIDNMGERLDSMRATDQVISENLSSVGKAMSAINENSVASTRVLDQMRQTITDREAAREKEQKIHSSRTGALMAIAVVMSMIAVAAVVLLAYFEFSRRAGH
jgi:chromosome segregation ATPase